MVDGIPVLSPTCLIPFKAKAWLDLKERKLNGEQVDSGYYERLLLSDGKAPSGIDHTENTGMIRDLLRWGIAEEALNSNRSGIVVKNPDGTDTELVTFSYEGGGNTQTLYSSAAAVYGFETLEDGSKALIINDKSQFNMQRKNYLYPIPLSQIQLNPALLQNPGY